MVPFDDPDAQKLIAEVQQEYIARYGDPDETPVTAHEFEPPNGLFLVGYLDDRPVASGAWRRHAADAEGYRDGDIEIKRMYVGDSVRGKGFARRILAKLESTAREAGARRMVLETGTVQPEAIELYRSSGYRRIPNYGHYTDHPLSVCLAKELDEDSEV